MNGLRYYLDLDCGFLFAYDERSEFFVEYLKGRGEWQSCSFSFLSFRHERNFKEIDEGEASRITDGKLPEDELSDYLRMLERNRGASV